MKFKVNKIAAAVAVSLGTSVVGMNAARADSILFPYVALSNTVTTILSVINDDSAALAQLHYRYYRNNAAGPLYGDGVCNEFNFENSTSPNDIVTFDMNATFSGDDPQGVLFEPQRTNAVYTDDFAIIGRNRGNAQHRGYVVVDNAFDETQPIPAPEARLAGEAIVIEFDTGSAWGYRAYNASEIWGLNPAGQLLLLNHYDFSDRVEQNGEVLVAAPRNTPARVQKTDFWVPVSILPWDAVTTNFFVTAIGTAAPFQGPSGSSAYRATIELIANADAGGRVMFDRDERAYSGNRPATVTCVGAVPARAMVDNLVVQSTPQGGWSNLRVTNGQAIVFKAEFNPNAPSELNGVTVSGSFNNVTWLRKGFRESLGRPLTLGEWNHLPTFNVPGIDNNAPYPVFLTAGPETLNQGLPLPPPPGGGAAYYDTVDFAAPADVAAAIARGDVFISNVQ